MITSIEFTGKGWVWGFASTTTLKFIFNWVIQNAGDMKKQSVCCCFPNCQPLAMHKNHSPVLLWKDVFRRQQLTGSMAHDGFLKKSQRQHGPMFVQWLAATICILGVSIIYIYTHLYDTRIIVFAFVYRFVCYTYFFVWRTQTKHSGAIHLNNTPFNTPIITMKSH